MNTAIEERIRNRAYELWEAEGRPEGREIDHWLQAAQELADARPAPGAGARPRARAPRAATTGAATRTPSAAAGRSRSRASKPKGTVPLS